MCHSSRCSQQSDLKKMIIYRASWGTSMYRGWRTRPREINHAFQTSVWSKVSKPYSYRSHRWRMRKRTHRHTYGQENGMYSWESVSFLVCVEDSVSLSSLRGGNARSPKYLELYSQLETAKQRHWDSACCEASVFPETCTPSQISFSVFSTMRPLLR